MNFSVVICFCRVLIKLIIKKQSYCHKYVFLKPKPTNGESHGIHEYVTCCHDMTETVESGVKHLQ